MAAKTRDSRAKAVLATAAIVWEKLASQRSYQGQSNQVGDLVDQLDTAIIDRASCAISIVASKRVSMFASNEGRNADAASAAARF